MDIWSDLEDELERYRSSSTVIRQYLDLYEGECRDLINKISDCSSFEEAQASFDVLHEIQRNISTVNYKFEFPLSDRLRDFIYHLDRDDVYSREYWYKEFRKGKKWPEE